MPPYTEVDYTEDDEAVLKRCIKGIRAGNDSEEDMCIYIFLVVCTILDRSKTPDYITNADIPKIKKMTPKYFSRGSTTIKRLYHSSSDAFKAKYAINPNYNTVRRHPDYPMPSRDWFHLSKLIRNLDNQNAMVMSLVAHNVLLKR